MSAESKESTPVVVSRQSVVEQLDALLRLAAEDLTKDDIIDAISGVASLPKSQLAFPNPLDIGGTISVDYHSGVMGGRPAEFANVTVTRFDGTGPNRQEFFRSGSDVIYGRTGERQISELQKPLSPGESKEIIDLLRTQV